MRKLFLVTLLVLVSAAGALAQNSGEIPNMGRAPKEPNGIGRLDLRVFDEQGNPVQGVHAELESRRTDGFFCESWNWTDARGVSVLPPIHMGRLTLKLKAKGFEKQKIEINASSLDQPVRITMVRKS
jgi:hypothetical protein